MARRELNPRQRRFVAEYLIDLNATAAAIRSGYSPNRASEIGYQLLQKTPVKRAVQEGMRTRAARTRVTADRVVRELALIAFSNIGDYQITPDGHLKARKTADRGSMRAVASFRRKVRRRIIPGGDGAEQEDIEAEFKMWDKVRALDLLCQHLGMLKTPGPDPIHDFIAKLPPDVAQNLRALLGLDGPAGRAGGPGG